MTRAKGPTFDVAFRRRREKRTNYAKRLALVKSGVPRMVVRKSNRYILVQFIEFQSEGDRCLVTVDANKLKKATGWEARRNSWTAYLAGLLAGKEAMKKGVTNFVLDVGMQTPSKGAVVFAALKGAVDAGLKNTYDEGMVPSAKLANPPEKLKAAFEGAKSKLR
ncbi:MAG: 50S ribosomal protein L18 [Candidatus Micrarchaeota archaeon]